MLQETNKDKELQSLKHYISTGWPVKRSQIPVFLHPYWNFRDELIIESGILMKNSKVLIAETLKQKYLRQIHQGHQGIEACRSGAREFVFWVNINSDLKELVEKCELCQSQQNSTAIVQKYVSEVPPHPWHMLSSDLFLVVVEILFGRKLRSSISILPSQVMNDRISKQRELIAKKEGKFYTNTKDFQDRIKALPFEAG